MADFIKDTLEKIPGVDPRVGQRMTTFSGMNNGPAETAARLAGLVQEKEQIDDCPYYTGNFGQGKSLCYIVTWCSWLTSLARL